MARTRVVTRTIVDTVYEVMVLNTKTCEVTTKNLTLGAIKYPNDEKALNALKKAFDTDTEKIATISDTFEREQIFGMLETDFMRYARPMDSERHFIGDDTELDTEE